MVDPAANSERIADILIAANKIQAIESQISEWPEQTVIQDGQGLVLGPGLVDLYSTSGEPGHEERETLASLAQAAIAGGFTRLAILPNTQPVIDNAAVVTALQQQTATLPGNKKPHVYFWGALTTKLQAQQMADLAELNPHVVGFADGKPFANLQLQCRLLEYLQSFQKPIALVATNLDLQGSGVMREGANSIRFGLPGDPETSETTAIASLLEMVAVMNVPVHIMRVSTQRGVKLIAAAKQRGLPVTASTTWMHLLLDTGAIASYDPNLRLTPPLGNPHDRAALVEGVKAGVIEAIAIDHRAYTYEEMMVGFASAPSGAIGLEFALPLLWQTFVANGEWTALELWRALSSGPMHCLGRSPMMLGIDQPAELTLFDPRATWKIDRQSLQSLSNNTPYFGQTITGKVVKVW